MAEPETLPGDAAADRVAGEPVISVVVTVFDEAATLDELHARTTAALEPLGPCVERAHDVLVPRIAQGLEQRPVRGLREHAADEVAGPAPRYAVELRNSPLRTRPPLGVVGSAREGLRR